MELVVGENAYLDVEEADEIINTELSSDIEEYRYWFGLSDDRKRNLLIRGTRLVDTLLFRGRKTVLSNKLKFPRYIDGKLIEIPYEVKAGLVLNVIEKELDNSKEEVRLQKLGVKNYSIKGASISFSDNKSLYISGIKSDLFEEYFMRYVY